MLFDAFLGGGGVIPGCLTGEHKEDDPIHDQDGPEDRHVEDFEPGAEEANADGAGRPVPELELGKSADEGAELLVLLGRQAARGPVFHLTVYRIVGRVELGRQESEEHVEEVDAERVGDYANKDGEPLSH